MPPRSNGDEETTDPVCGEVFPASLAVFHSTHRGRTVSFCSKTCKTAFDAAPDDHPPAEGDA